MSSPATGAAFIPADAPGLRGLLGRRVGDPATSRPRSQARQRFIGELVVPSDHLPTFRKLQPLVSCFQRFFTMTDLAQNSGCPGGPDKRAGVAIVFTDVGREGDRAWARADHEWSRGRYNIRMTKPRMAPFSGSQASSRRRGVRIGRMTLQRVTRRQIRLAGPRYAPGQDSA